MATLRPNALKYIQCELPNEVEQLLVSFYDDISVGYVDFEDRLDAFIKDVLPEFTKELTEIAEVSDELVAGSPIPALQDMEAIEESLNFTNPKTEKSGAAEIRLDERKLGAAGIVALNGVFYRRVDSLDLNGSGRLDAFRYLWDSVSGDYDAFIALGNSIAFANDGEFTLLEKYIFDDNRLPDVQKPFAQLVRKPSQYKYYLLWTSKVVPSSANNLKLRTLGYTADQVLNVFGGRDPNGTINEQARLSDIQLSIRRLTQLLFTLPSDPTRQPRWFNEFNHMKAALTKYLTFRYDSSFKMATFDPVYWEVVKSNLQEADLKELFENRPEVHDMIVPTPLDDLQNLFDQAFRFQAGSNGIHTYIMGITKKKPFDVIETQLWDLGLGLFKELLRSSKERGFNVNVDPVTDRLSGGSFHGLAANDAVLFASERTPPGGLVSGSQVYYVVNPTKIDFQLSLTPGGAPVDIKNIGVGYHRIVLDMNVQVYLSQAQTLAALMQELLGEVVPYDLTTAFKNAAKNATGPQFKNTIFKTTDEGDGIKDDEDDPTAIPLQQLASDLEEEIKDSDNPDLLNKSNVLDSTVEDQKTNLAKTSAGMPTQDSGASLVARMFKAAKQDRECNAQKSDESRNMENSITDPRSAALANTYLVPTAAVDPAARPEGVDVNKLYRDRSKENVKIQNIVRFDKSGVNTTTNYLDIPSHGFRQDQELFFRAKNGTLPTPLTEDAHFYVLKVEKDRFSIARNIGTNQVNFSNIQDGNFEVFTKYTENKASARRDVTSVQETPRAQRNIRFDVVCKPKWENGFTRILADLEGKFRKFIIRVCNILKQILVDLQNKIDEILAKIQIVLDATLARLERLLTFEFAIGGTLGIENSMIKCNWGLDLRLDLDLFGRLLTLINRFFRKWYASIKEFLDLIQEFIDKIICVPVRLLEAMLGSINTLLNQIGCSLKDIKLPTEILDLLKGLLAALDLRTISIRKGYEALNGISSAFRLLPSAFHGLAQFGALCNDPAITKALNGMDNALRAAIAGPFKGSDLVGKSIEESLSATFSALV